MRGFRPANVLKIFNLCEVFPSYFCNILSSQKRLIRELPTFSGRMLLKQSSPLTYCGASPLRATE